MKKLIHKILCFLDLHKYELAGFEVNTGDKIETNNSTNGGER